MGPAVLRRQLGDFAPEGVDVGLRAGDGGLELRRAVDVLLVVLLVALALWLAVVVKLLQRGERGLGLGELVLQDAAGVGVALALLVGTDPAGGAARAGDRARHARRRDGGGLLRLLGLAALGLGLLRRQRVGEHIARADVVDRAFGRTRGGLGERQHGGERRAGGAGARDTEGRQVAHDHHFIVAQNAAPDGDPTCQAASRRTAP